MPGASLLSSPLPPSSTSRTLTFALRPWCRFPSASRRAPIRARWMPGGPLCGVRARWRVRAPQWQPGSAARLAPVWPRTCSCATSTSMRRCWMTAAWRLWPMPCPSGAVCRSPSRPVELAPAARCVSPRSCCDAAEKGARRKTKNSAKTVDPSSDAPIWALILYRSIRSCSFFLAWRQLPMLSYVEIGRSAYDCAWSLLRRRLDQRFRTTATLVTGHMVGSFARLVFFTPTFASASCCPPCRRPMGLASKPGLGSPPSRLTPAPPFHPPTCMSPPLPLTYGLCGGAGASGCWAVLGDHAAACQQWLGHNHAWRRRR